MYLYEGLYTGPITFPFPLDLLPDEEDRNAVLVQLACDESIARMHELMKSMLRCKFKPIF